MSDTFNHEADAWDSLNDDNDDIEWANDGSPKSPAPYCKYCGSREVYWIHSGVRWRLYNKDATKLHVCNRASADDFDDLTKE